MNEAVRGIVERKVVEHFAPRDREAARRELDRIEDERVRLAAIKLADGDPALLSQYVAVALIDWRDVIAWAESPGLMASGLPVSADPAQAAILERDRVQYERWLETEGPYSE